MLDGQSSLTGMTSVRARAIHPPSRILWAGLIVCTVVLAGCATRTSRAPVVDMSNASSAAAPAPGSTYVVKPGDTLFKISREHGVDIDSLKRWNNLSDTNLLTVGQVLKLSGSGSGSGSGASASSGSSGAVRPSTAPGAADGPVATPLPPPGQSASQAPAEASAPAAVEPPRPPRAGDAGIINWGWPAEGALLQTFSRESKGIDIAGNPGDPVVAAADGKVMYSGNGVRGLGNLVIINHSNGFITAYAHNRTLLVKTGQDVKRGAKIAEVGQTDTSSPRLHFEIRRQGTPVDPMQYLPPR